MVLLKLVIYLVTMPEEVKPSRSPIKRLYAWTVKWSKHPKAERALGALSFAESSFFPVPPDPLLLTMTFSEPSKWRRYALLATTMSVLGGIFGYLIGFLLWDTVGTIIIDGLHLAEGFEIVGAKYQEFAFIAVLTAAFSPIPYKVFTIAGGVFRINFPLFVLASIMGRGGRFFMVALAANYFGKKHAARIEKYIDYISLGFVAVLVIAYLIFR